MLRGRHRGPPTRSNRASTRTCSTRPAGPGSPYTGEADGKHAGAFANSPEAGEFYTSLARWAAGRPGQLADGLAVTQEVRNGVNRIRLHLDPDRKTDPFAGTPRVTTLTARPGDAPRAESVALTWTGPDTLTAEVPLGGGETALSTVSVPGQRPQALAPVCLPYSPEYTPVAVGATDPGREALDRLARATGGVERVELTGIWADLPRRPRSVPLAPWLLVAAAVCLLVEVLERRSGLVSHLARRVRDRAVSVVRFRRKRPAPAATTPVPPPGAPASEVPPAGSARFEAPESGPSGPAPEHRPPPGDVLDAMRKARDRTRGRGGQ